MTPLHWAVHHEHLKMVELLVNAGAQKHFISIFGDTPLLMALENNNHDIVQMLKMDHVSMADIESLNGDSCSEKSNASGVDDSNLIEKSSPIEMPEMDYLSAIACESLDNNDYYSLEMASVAVEPSKRDSTVDVPLFDPTVSEVLDKMNLVVEKVPRKNVAVAKPMDEVAIDENLDGPLDEGSSGLDAQSYCIDFNINYSIIFSSLLKVNNNILSFYVQQIQEFTKKWNLYESQKPNTSRRNR